VAGEIAPPSIFGKPLGRRSLKNCRKHDGHQTIHLIYSAKMPKGLSPSANGGILCGVPILRAAEVQ
jgi:hypothetical protein